MKSLYKNYKQTIKKIPIIGEMLLRIKQQINKKVPTGGEFKSRIQHRSQTFWADPQADIIRNMCMHASDPLSKWKDVNHWQKEWKNC